MVSAVEIGVTEASIPVLVMDTARRGVVVMVLNGGCSSRVCYSRTLEGRGRRSTIIFS